MKIQELIRNIIEINKTCSSVYNALCSFQFYRNFVNKKISDRLEYLKNHNELKFMIETTGICNAKCIFCPYTKLQRAHIPMSDEIFNRIIYQIKYENIIPKTFDLFMIGEPFLDKKIFERIKIIKENFPTAKINITSNFNICDSNITSKIINSDIDFINISLNSVEGNKYKELMGLDYDKTINNINILIKERKKQKNKKLKIGLSMVIYDNEKMINIIKFLFKWIFKVDTIRFQRAVTWGNQVKVKNLLGKTGKKLYPCNDLFERIPILSNGDFALCCQDSEGIIKLNIMDNEIIKVWNSGIYSKIREIHLSDGLKDFKMCQNCFGINSNGANWIFTDR